MASLDGLPAELQVEICSYLTTTDIKAVRAACKVLRDNATPFLFHCILACARYRAMGAFWNIASRTDFAPHVKQIVFDGTVYIEQVANNEEEYYCAESQLSSEGTPSPYQQFLRYEH